MPLKKFSVAELKENGLPYASYSDDYEIISDTVTDTSRWSVYHSLIFRYKDKYYSCEYSVGATELQDESPWEYEKEVLCQEVHLVERTIKVWEPIVIKRTTD
jgi:hypothetical protein